jgi:hypothetical protein
MYGWGRVTASARIKDQAWPSLWVRVRLGLV